MPNLKNKLIKLLSSDHWSNNTASNLARQLKVSRNLVSQYLNDYFKAGILGKINSRPVIFFKLNCPCDIPMTFTNQKQARKWNQQHLISPLDKVIGSKESLRDIIKQIKAAIQYPPTGLPILLSGATGTGKSYLAHVAYEHLLAQGMISPNARFMALNCSEYANNPELFLANFFGAVRGAYTGAEKTTKGMVQIADGGVLFLDEIHSLSNECQEKLFQFMDTDKFHQLGDNEHWHQAHCWFIFATSKDYQKELLSTLLRRIPVKITLPTLEQRTNIERKKLIQFFFLNEEKRLQRQITISMPLLKYLMNYPFSGNIGNLKNSIQLICANALATNINALTLNLTISDLPRNIKLSIYALKLPNQDIATISIKQLIPPENNYAINQIFKIFLDERNKCTDLTITFKNFDQTLRKIFKNLQPVMPNFNQTFVESKIHQFFQRLENDYGIKINSFYYNVILNLFGKKEYQKGNQPFNQTNYQKLKSEIIAQNPDENQLLSPFFEGSEIYWNDLEKLLFLILFKLMIGKDIPQRIPALIIAHGNQSATTIAQTANQFNGKYLFDAVNLPLKAKDLKMQQVINHFLKVNQNCHNLIVLIDLGNPQKLCAQLEFNPEQNLAIINHASNALAIDVGNQLNLHVPLFQILANVTKNQKISSFYQKQMAQPKMIVCSCASGLGTAEKLKKILAASFPPDSQIVIATCDYYSIAQEHYLDELSQNYQVLFVVGTLDPKIKSTPFYSIEDLILGINLDRMKDQLAQIFNSQQLTQINDQLLKNFSLTNLMDQLTILNPSKLLEQVSDAIYILQNTLNLELKNNTCFGLYIHICCLIERLVTQPDLQDEVSLNKTTNPDFEKFKTAFSTAFTVVEKYYSVEIPEIEINYVYDYINKA